MNEIITTKSIGAGIVDVSEDFILLEEPMSRLVFHAQIHENGIRGKIIRQRRESSSDKWVPDETIHIRSLEKNEAININMKTESIKNLYSAISKLANILKQRGVEYGVHSYSVVDPDTVIITDENKTAFIKKLLNAGYDEEIWNNLAESSPSLVTKLTNAKIIEEKQIVLAEFNRNLLTSLDEQYWQNFFNANQWIFGYGLKYQFLNLVNGQPRYIGANYTGSGEQRGDFLMSTEAEKKYTVLVEIKRPESIIVLNEQYRNGVAKLGQELLWAVSQVQMNCISWFREGSRTDFAKDNLEKNDIYTYAPKGILVIGHTKQLDSREKIQTFESYRRNLHNPEIITFDELSERAKFIIEHSKVIT